RQQPNRRERPFRTTPRMQVAAASYLLASCLVRGLTHAAARGTRRVVFSDQIGPSKNRTKIQPCKERKLQAIIFSEMCCRNATRSREATLDRRKGELREQVQSGRGVDCTANTLSAPLGFAHP